MTRRLVCAAAGAVTLLSGCAGGQFLGLRTSAPPCVVGAGDPPVLGLQTSEGCVYWMKNGKRVLQPVNGICPPWGE